MKLRALRVRVAKHLKEKLQNRTASQLHSLKFRRIG